MTREEAIKELTELLPEEFLSEYAEAIRMAIEALEQPGEMDVYILIEVTKGEVLGIYDSEEKAKNDIKFLPKFMLVNVSKPIRLNTLL